jgi:hypothetical protein
MFLRVHGKPTPQFYRQIAPKTVLIGLSSTVFRDAKFTSHEVTIDEQQLQWFQDTLERHPAADGWRVFVFTHAPPAGSGLKVLAENHVVNGCCWLNQSHPQQCRTFIQLVRQHRCIKAWFSGHFHLGQDYRNSITFPNTHTANDDDDDDAEASATTTIHADNTDDEEEGLLPDRGSCVFCQTSVMRTGTSRDGHCQSRVLRGNDQGFEILTVDHANQGKVRIDARVTYTDCNNEMGTYIGTTEDDDDDDDVDDKAEEDTELPSDDETHQFEQLYEPIDDEKKSAYLVEDEMLGYDDDGVLLVDDNVSTDTSAWFTLKCGTILGIYNGNLLEYDPLTLAPLGLVVSADELTGKQVAVIDVDNDSEDDDNDNNDSTTSGTESVQAVVLIDEDDESAVVVQPNEDGSYWRKIVRNKMVRMLEMRREKAAKQFVQELLDNDEAQVVSSWGPYKQTSGVAKSTGESDLLLVQQQQQQQQEQEQQSLSSSNSSSSKSSSSANSELDKLEKTLAMLSTTMESTNNNTNKKNGRTTTTTTTSSSLMGTTQKLP